MPLGGKGRKSGVARKVEQREARDVWGSQSGLGGGDERTQKYL